MPNPEENKSDSIPTSLMNELVVQANFLIKRCDFCNNPIQYGRFDNDTKILQWVCEDHKNGAKLEK